MSRFNRNPSMLKANKLILSTEWYGVCERKELLHRFANDERVNAFEDWVIGKLAEMQTDIEALEASETAKILKPPPF